MERKTLTLTETKVDRSAAGSFTGYASLWGILDSQGDVVLKGAYTDTLPQFLERGFISWGHDWNEPVATIREAYEDDKGLYLAADFHSDDFSQRARTRTVERIERGKFMGLSIGYLTVDAEFTDTARLLKKLDLFETGLVTVPALREAGVSDAKAGDSASDAAPPDPLDALVALTATLQAEMKEGRTFSIANVSRMQAALGQIRDAETTLQTMLDGAAPAAASNSGKGRALWLAFDRICARQAGVAV